MFDSLLRLATVAMAAPGGAGPGAGSGGVLGNPLFLVGMIAIMFYFLLYKPERKKKEEREKLLKGLQKGDEVMTAGGIYGKITALTEQNVTIEIAPNVRVKIGRQYVSNVTVAEDKGKDKDKPEGNGKK